jgi:hypothetical protein
MTVQSLNKCFKVSTRVASDKVYQLLVHGRWFSPGTLASSTTKIGRHDIAEKWLKVALSTKNQINQSRNKVLIDNLRTLVKKNQLIYIFNNPKGKLYHLRVECTL